MYLLFFHTTVRKTIQGNGRFQTFLSTYYSRILGESRRVGQEEHCMIIIWFDSELFSFYLLFYSQSLEPLLTTVPVLTTWNHRMTRPFLTPEGVCVTHAINESLRLDRRDSSQSFKRYCGLQNVNWCSS